MESIFKTLFIFSAVLLSMMVTEVKRGYTQEQAEESPFIVHNINVDVTADSAKQARDKAFRQAQKKSLPVLIQQLEENGYDTVMIKQAAPELIANAVRDFEISNEKISAVRYKGDFVFRYDEALLSHYFYGSGSLTDPYNASYFPNQNTGPASITIPPKQDGRDRVLVLPFFQSGSGRMALWNGYNPWRDIWMRSSTGTILAPIGDISDIRDIDDDEALTYNPERVANMIERYSADRVVILIGTHENASLPTSLSEKAEGLFRVSIYDTARGRPDFINDIKLEESSYKNFGEVLQAGYNRSVEKIYALNPIRSIGHQEYYAETQHHQRSPQLYEDIQSSYFQGRIEYTSMQDWVAAQKVLRSVEGISNLEVLSMTARQAEVRVHFQGRLDAVATNMSRKGYNIQKTSKPGRYLIYTRRQSAYNENGGIVYR